MVHLFLYPLVEELKELWFGVMFKCDRACKNQPCECKLHRVIFLLISLVPNALLHFRKLQKKAH